MKSELECEESAREAVTQYVNGCKCDTQDDAFLALLKLVIVSMEMLQTVKHGKMEIVQ